jgi:hypothetical protein
MHKYDGLLVEFNDAALVRIRKVRLVGSYSGLERSSGYVAKLVARSLASVP